MNESSANKKRSSRRDFLKKSGAAAVGASFSFPIGQIPAVHAAGSDQIRVGLIGCGGRGTGAASQVLRAAPNVKLVAMGDAFRDRLDSSRKKLQTDLKDLVDVPAERSFVGFDACEKVLACNVNYVILATQPGFRPAHLKAAVAAGKNIFTEK